MFLGDDGLDLRFFAIDDIGFLFGSSLLLLLLLLLLVDLGPVAEDSVDNYDSLFYLSNDDNDDEKFTLIGFIEQNWFSIPPIIRIYS